MNTTFDYDWLVIGSGFGSSVSALPLSEKGFCIGVLEGAQLRVVGRPNPPISLYSNLFHPTGGMS
jgi:cholesterol oxidase